jgi:hypothetical protein
MSFGIYHAFHHDLCDINSFIDFDSTARKKDALAAYTIDEGKLFYRLTFKPREAINKAGEHFYENCVIVYI